MDRRRRRFANTWIAFESYGTSRLKAGNKIRVVRLPVFHRNDPPAERETVKTVASVDHGSMLVRIKGMWLPGFRGRILRPFKLSPKGELTTGSPRPLRFQILDVLPA